MEQTKYINVADLRSVLDKYNANEIEFEVMVQELNEVIGDRVKRINRTFSRLAQTSPVFSEMQEYRKQELESLNEF